MVPSSVNIWPGVCQKTKLPSELELRFARADEATLKPFASPDSYSWGGGSLGGEHDLSLE